MRIQACNNKQNTNQHFGMVSLYLAGNHSTISIVKDMPHVVCVGDKFFDSKFASRATRYIDVITSFVNANLSAKRLNPEMKPVKTPRLREFKEILGELVGHAKKMEEISQEDAKALKQVIDSADENNIIPMNLDFPSADIEVRGLILGEVIK